MLSVALKLLSGVFMLMLRAGGTGSFPPPLEKNEEHELFLKAKQGDKNARTKLIEHNLRLVAHIVKKYYGTSTEQDDLISIGTVGLIKAIDSFDPEKGAKFATYAGKCLQNEILMYFRGQKKQSLENSLNDAVDVDKDGNPLTYLDILASDEDIAEEIGLKLQAKRLYQVIDSVLEPREKTVIILRYGLNGGKAYPQRQVAQRLGISRSYVSRIEKTALEKIKENL